MPINYHQNENGAIQSDLSLPVNKQSYECPALRSGKDNIEFYFKTIPLVSTP
jgi:hypothetical protein